ncbi:MAG: hypothetical protein AVDCRST_MAG65-251 [uncultured Solirubrobacteraceae bacterium]|uniref:ScyD/ScyE family protein n=1 Tax=uncultured Solirubrobacteraceae bacterium TaxID=1162706 RepID=A0A6J4R6N1_9ACTN|nr:MAG: hypothetical protein AVDCRST_MAG65-251 [uncultured Solirubrobacteraceae bacterium]
MSESRARAGRDVVASLVAGLAVAAITASTAAAQELKVVTGGLANPRGMSFGPGGHLYVAESGRGGSGRCVSGPEGGEVCVGATGAITRVDVSNGRQRRIVARLPSLAVQEGADRGANATGPNDVSFNGRTAYFTIGLGAAPAARAEFGRAGRRLGTLHRRNSGGKVVRVADLANYEARRNPDAGQPGAALDSNPYSVDASIAGRVLVTDAGGNDLLQVGRRGRIRTLSVFPTRQTPAPPFLNLPPGAEIPYQAVPTGVVRAGARTTYVGQLTGFPFPAGTAQLFRVRGGGDPTVKARGFTTIVDVAVGRRGTVYVLQISANGLAADPSPGKLIRISRNGRQTELAAGRLQQPTGLAVAPNGDVYVANRGGSATRGQIVRIRAR